MSQVIVISWMTQLCVNKMFSEDCTYSVGLGFPSIVCLHLVYELLIMYNPFISYLSASSYWCYCWRRGWRNSAGLSDSCWSYYICCCLLTKTETEIYKQHNCNNTVMLYACFPSVLQHAYFPSVLQHQSQVVITSELIIIFSHISRAHPAFHHACSIPYEVAVMLEQFSFVCRPVLQVRKTWTEPRNEPIYILQAPQLQIYFVQSYACISISQCMDVLSAQALSSTYIYTIIHPHIFY